MPNTPLTVLLDIHTTELKHQVHQNLKALYDVTVLDHTLGSRGDVLITELNSSPETEFQSIGGLLDSGMVEEVFLLSNNARQDILLKSIKMGVKEFFILPLQDKELTEALEKVVAKRKQHASPAPTSHKGKLITVLGSRGGAGTTTVAVNLAAALAEQATSESILLLDLDVNMGEIPLFLDFTPQYSWKNLAENLSRIDDSFLRNVLYQHPNGFSILPGPEIQTGNVEAYTDMFEHMLRLLLRMFDVIIIDGGQSIHELIQQTLHRSDTVLIVSQLSLPYLSKTNKMLALLKQIVPEPEKNIHILINRYHKKINISLREAEASLKANIFSTIPNDYQFVMSAMNQGKVFNQAGARHKLTRTMQDLARQINPPSGSDDKAKKKWFSK